MADFGFGAAGVVGADAALHTEALTTKALGEIAMQPYEMRVQAAKAEHAELQLQAERNYAEISRRRMQQRMQQGSNLSPLQVTAEGRSASDLAVTELYNQAIDRIDAGQGELGGKIAVQAARVSRDEAQARNAQSSERLHTLQLARDRAGMIARHFAPGTITNQDTLDAAWTAANLGGQPPAYDPETTPILAQHIRNAGVTAHEQAGEEHQRLTRDERRRVDDATVEERRARSALHRASTALADARRARLGKVGATDDVKPADMAPIKEWLRTDYMNWDTPEESKRIARDIAIRAKELVADSPALTYQQASKQAYLEAQQSGDLEPYGRAKPKLPPGGKTKDKPRMLPRGPDGSVVQAKMSKGWYNFGGKYGVLYWNGTTATKEVPEEE